MKKLLIISRSFLLITVLVIGATTFVLGLVYESGFIHDKIRTETERQLSRQLQKKITIGQVKGNLINEATLLDIKFQNAEGFNKDPIFQIKSLKARFNLIKAIQRNGDFAAAAYELIMDDASLNIQRNSRNVWNVTHLLPPPPLQLPPPPITFSGKIYIKNLSLNFQDDHGWQPTPSVVSFTDSFTKFDGSINFKNLNKIDISLKGVHTMTQSPTTITGHFSGYNGQFNFDLDSEGLDINRWGPYVLSKPGFNLSGHIAPIQGRIWSKDPFPPRDTPFFFDLHVNLKDSELALPFFTAPIEKLSTQLSFQNGVISKQEIEQISGDSNKRLWNYLINSNLINTKGQFVSNINPKFFPYTKKWAHLTPYKQQVLSQLQKPETKLKLARYSGIIETIPIEGYGGFNITNDRMFLQTNTDHFHTIALKKLFPGIKNWKVSGKSQSNFISTGSISKPVISGKIMTKKGLLYGLSPKRVDIDFNYKGRILELTSIHAGLLNGTVSGNGNMNFNTTPTSLDFSISATDISPTSFSPLFPGSGTLNMQTHIEGKLTNYEVQSHLLSNTLTIRDQQIPVASGYFTVHDHKDIDISSMRININNNMQPIEANGHISNLSDLTLNLTVPGIRLIDKLTGNPSHVRMSGTITTPISKKAYQAPLSYITTSMNISINNGFYFSKPITDLNTAFKIYNKNIDIDYLTIKTDNESLELEGKFKNFKPLDVTLKTIALDIESFPLPSNRFLQALQPLSGKLTTDIHLVRVNKNQSKNKEAFWKHTQISGDFTIEDASIAYQPLEKIGTRFFWDTSKLTLTNSTFQKNQSQVDMSGTIHKNKTLNITIGKKSVIFLEDITLLSDYVENTEGKIDISGLITGSISNPNFFLSLVGTQVKNPYLNLDLFKGKLQFKNNNLSFTNFLLKNTKNHVTINGYTSLKNMLDLTNVDITNTDYNLDIDVKKGDLSSLLELYASIYNKYQARRSLVLQQQNPIVPNANITLSKKTAYEIGEIQTNSNQTYYSSTQPITILEDFFNKKQRSEAQKKSLLKTLQSLVKGEYSGRISAKHNNKKLPIIKANFTVNQTTLAALKTDKITLDFETKNNILYYSSFFDTGTLKKIPYAHIFLKGKYHQEGKLDIDKSELKQGALINTNFITGYFPIKTIINPDDLEKTINLKLRLANNNLKYLAILTPLIDSLESKGDLQINLLGTTQHPQFFIPPTTFQDTIFTWSDLVLFKSKFHIPKLSIFTEKNTLIAKEFQAWWQGIDTKDLYTSKEIRNTLSIKGKITVPPFSFSDIYTLTLKTDVTIADNQLTVNFPELYRGKISFNSFTVSGNYTIPLTPKAIQAQRDTISTEKETGPVLSGDLIFSNGQFTLPKFGQKLERPLFRLNLNTQLDENLSIASSLFGEGTLAGLTAAIELEIDKTVTPLLITGTLNSPSIQNKIPLARGSVFILNREFDLLQTFDQRLFFQNDPLLVLPNQLTFMDTYDPKTDKKSLTPVLNITALTTVEPFSSNNEISSENVTPLSEENKYKQILIRMQGPLTQLDALRFEEYETSSSTYQDGSLTYQNTYKIPLNSNIKETESARDTSQVLRLLIPDLYLSENSNQGTQRFGESVLANQLHYAIRRTFLRPIERQIANRIGIDDLKVNYNIGEALLKTTGTTSKQTDQNLGIDATKFLTDKLFIRVKTDLDKTTENGNANQLRPSEIALTYRIFQNLSVNYTNVRDVNDQFKPKVSLNYDYAF